ncbi:hypothetical protein N2152v2_007248 [Parachlorella kessleri]
MRLLPRLLALLLAQHVWAEVLDGEARIYLFHNFLTDEECDHIVGKAEPRLQRSGVVDTSSGGSEVSEIRTSSGMFFSRGEDAVIQDIEERISRWALLPAGHGEGMQVLRYNHNQKYEPHFDYFFHKEGTANGGNRYATVLMYLSDVEEGGETIFPNLPAPKTRDNSGFSDCAKPHVAVKPRKGDAVLFHSIRPTGEIERRSMHGACPVVKGIKWSAAKWMHVAHYAADGEVPVEVKQHVQEVVGPGGCKDAAGAECEAWALAGECTKNPGYMIGTIAKLGNCLRSCDRCDLHLAAQKKGSRKFAAED